MRKFLFGALILTMLFSWTYLGLTQKADPGTEAQESKVAQENDTADDDLAKKMIIQEQESRENLRRLAEGQVKSFEVTAVQTDQNQIEVNTFYTDDSSLHGLVHFQDIDGKVYITKITHDAAIPLLPGNDVATLSDEELQLGRDLVKSQAANQEVPKDLRDGNITKLVINSKTKDDADTTTLEATATLKDGSSKEVKINMVFLNGFWYIKSLGT